MSVKTRTLDPVVRPWHKKTEILGTIIQDIADVTSFSGLEETYSWGHKWPPPKNQRFRSDDGDGFLNLKLKVIDNSPTYNGPFSDGGIWSFENTGVLPVHFTLFEAKPSDLPAPWNSNDVTFYGIEGFTRTSPMKPKGQLAQALFELKGGHLPTFDTFKKIFEGVKAFKEAAENKRLIKLTRDGLGLNSNHPITSYEYRQYHARQLKAAANGYLTWEFDWLPFFGDVQDFCRNVKNSEKNYQKIVTNAAKPIHKKIDLLEDSNTDSTFLGSGYYGALPYVSPAYRSGGTLTLDTQIERKVWYSACFSYYVPGSTGTPAEKLAYFESLARVEFGLGLDPRTVWNVMPWTWLADWCSSTGNSISNLTDIIFGGLASQYNYVMLHYKSTVTYSWQGCTLANGFPARGTQTLVYEVKQRSPGYSFGFALNPADFSAKQDAILAALGISKGANYHLK